MKDLICIIPFVHLSSRPNGVARRCCTESDGPYDHTIFNENGTPFSYDKDSISKIWNSKKMIEFRQQMLNGGKPPECSSCWKEEAHGKASKRIRSDGMFHKYLDRVEKARANNGYVDEPPVSLDIRLGNLCNLKCRMCSPLFSSKFAKEVTHSWDESLKKLRQFPGNKDTIYLPEWFSSPLFYESFQKILPSMKEIYITGGEPSIIKKMEEMLQLIIDQGFHKNIVLRINTNASVVDNRFFELVWQFKQVILSPSIDDIGQRLTYLRHPLEWETLKQNMDVLLSTPSNVRLHISCTVSIYNVFYVDELIKYFRKRAKELNKESMEIEIFILRYPDFMDASLLPSQLKQQTIAKLESLLQEKDLTPKLKSSLKALISWLSKNEYNISHIKQLKVYTQGLDKIRGESFSQTFPELMTIFEGI